MIKNNKNIIILGIIPVWIISLIFILPHSFSYWLNYWWMFPIALVVAMIVNTVGISGAALFVPFFILIFPMLATPLSASESIKLGLITESFGLSSSALAFIWFGLVDKKLGFSTILVAIPFVITGSFLSFILPDNVLRIFVVIALVIASILMINKKRRDSKIECIKHNTIGKHHKHQTTDNITLTDKTGKIYKYCRICGRKKRFKGYALGGLFQGAAGFGIGELGILSMVITDIPIRIAIGTSHMIVAVTAIIASIVHLSNTTSSDPTPWNILIMSVPAVLIGGQIAPYISSRLKSSFLENFVIVLFAIISVSLFLSVIF